MGDWTRPRDRTPEPMRPALAAATLLAAALLAAPAAAGADAVRGRVLYESGCVDCHAESVHGRAHREAKDFESVRAWVRRWGANLGLKWTPAEVDDVAAYLNQRYYHFACPPAVCSTTGAAPSPAPGLAALRDAPR